MFSPLKHMSFLLILLFCYFSNISVLTNVTATPERDGDIFQCLLNFIAEAGDAGEPPSYKDNCSTYFHVLRVYLFL